MFSKNIRLKSFPKKNIKNNFKKLLKNFLNENNEIIKSFTSRYKDVYKISKIKKDYKLNDIRLIGMGGSILGSQAIYNFLREKIKKKFIFVNNLVSVAKEKEKKKIYKFNYF